jgi:hypothetical protein
MGKYPKIEPAKIAECVSKIESDLFSTHDFINVWSKRDVRMYNVYRGTGTGRRIVVGRNLAEHAAIKATHKRKDGAELWKKK